MIKFLDENFSQLNSFLNNNSFSKILILTDENTNQYCLPTLLGNLETDLVIEIIEIEPGEDLKTIDTAIQLWEIFTEYEVDRKALLINLGGGVISDLGGFVASTYKRGFSFVNIPTSLLAMCDAAIGGKTGVDHQSLKNIVGTFSLPKSIFIFLPFLKTLPKCELTSGFAEMIKHGLIADSSHFHSLTSIENINSLNITPSIPVSIEIKNRIVEKDYEERQERKTLNFGHTVGHAIESLFLESKNPILHGEAVAVGMICETHLSYLNGLISEPISLSIISKIGEYFPYISIEKFTNTQIISLMKNDKKNSFNTIKFSLLKDIGLCVFDQICEEKQVSDSLDFYRNFEKEH